MSVESKALLLKLTTLRDLLRKNCGVGSGGFQPGNHCQKPGGSGSSEGSERRHAAAKRRRRKGPGHALPDRARSKRRQQAGRNNANRRQFVADTKSGKYGSDGKDLLKSQTAERKELADSFRQTRKEDRKVERQAHKDLGKEIRKERKEGVKDRAKERSTLKKDQAKETARLEKDHAKEAAKLDAKYEAAKAKTKDPDSLESSYREKKDDLGSAHKEALDDLAAEHKQARRDLAIDHREARVNEREDHRDRINSQRDDDALIRSQQHGDQHDQIADQRFSHRNERADLKREAREGRHDDEKSYSYVDVAASPDPEDVPDAQSILDGMPEAKDCGTGSGGFKPGNSCGRGGGVARSPEQKERARKRFHKKLRKAFPFLKDKDIGNLTEARGDRASSASLPRNQITAHEHDIIYGTMSDHDNGIRKPREIHAVESESKKWRLSAAVSTNPMHGVMAGEKKYKVEYSAEGPNHQGHDYVDHFNSRTKALAAAEKGHAALAKEYAPSLAPKTTPTVKDLFRKAGTTPARMDKLIYKQETPWHDVPHDQQIAWLANERARIKNASKSAGKGEIRKGPHGAPIAWFDVDTRIAGGKVRWGEWTAADERATTGDAKGLVAVVGKAASEDGPSGVPDARAILDGVLEATGFGEAWRDGSLSGDDRLAVLDAVSAAGQAWLRGEAESTLEDVSTKALLGEARAKVSGFFKRAGKYVRELITAGVLAVTGPGPANQTDAIVQATQDQVAEQLKYLDKFKQQIISEEKPLTPEFAARAEQYGAAAWATSLEVERQGVIAAGKASEVLRVLGPNENHCPECPPLADLGWVKMKDAERLGVAPLGRTECRIFCRCHLRYR